MLVVLDASVIVARPELGLGDLQDHADEPLTDLDPAQCDGGAPVGAQLHAGGAVVVEPLREADVLVADGESDPASDALATGRVPGPAGQADRVARQCLRPPGTGIAAAARITSATGSDPVSTCPVGSVSPGSIAFRSRSSIGSIPSASASRSICASAAKHTCTAPKPRIAPHGGLFV